MFPGPGQAEHLLPIGKCACVWPCRSTQAETLSIHANANSTSGLILFLSLVDQSESLLAENTHVKTPVTGLSPCNSWLMVLTFPVTSHTHVFMKMGFSVDSLTPSLPVADLDLLVSTVANSQAGLSSILPRLVAVFMPDSQSSCRIIE